MKIALDFGHTLRGADTGAEGNGRREQDCTREIGNKLYNKLVNAGYEVKIVSVDSANSVNESLSARVNNANNWGANLYISIHLNSGGGTGTEVFTYKGQENAYARNILNSICSLGYTNRGIKGSNLYVINHTNMSAMLIECCFIDNAHDMGMYAADNFAEAIYRGITGQESNNTPHQPLNNDILELQRELNIQGFRDKNGNSLVEDGIAGALTLSACPLLKQGATGNITRWVQRKLVSLGYNTNGIDGIFGNGTKSAVQSFQFSRGLSNDGIIGNGTWSALLGL
jgi:N-acetylmuramoyl-L-alanine amidase